MLILYIYIIDWSGRRTHLVDYINKNNNTEQSMLFLFILKMFERLMLPPTEKKFFLLATDRFIHIFLFFLFVCAMLTFV